MSDGSYTPRIIDGLLSELVAELPAVMVVGPRACGKTTTAATLSQTIVRLDRPAEARIFEADPDLALEGLAEPLLLDEWQSVPDVLGAVKRAVDSEARPGRFVLTGSVNARLEAMTWPGTGRIITIAATPMSERELHGSVSAEGLIDRIVQHGADALTVSQQQVNLRDYLDMALRGGFPEPAMRYGEQGRRRWYEGYLEQLFTRDAQEVSGRRDPDRMRRFFHALALHSSSIVELTKLAQATDIDRHTSVEYEQLLKNLFIVDAIPAWAERRLKRLTRASKRILCDAALIEAATGISIAGVMREGDLLGAVLETFVAAQLRAELAAAQTRPRLYHLRQADGRHEIDFILEVAGGQVIAIEVKANAAPSSAAIQHLAWLRDLIGDRFLIGLLLHTGPRTYKVDNKIYAAPIKTLWE